MRRFYLNECINSKWSVRELQRQRDSLLYERLILSQNKEKVLELAEKGQILKTGKDLVKDPFVLEFLDIKENLVFYNRLVKCFVIIDLKIGKITHQDIGKCKCMLIIMTEK